MAETVYDYLELKDKKSLIDSVLKKMYDIREERGISAEKIDDLAEFQSDYYKRIEQKEIPLTSVTVESFCLALCIPFYELIPLNFNHKGKNEIDKLYSDLKLKATYMPTANSIKDGSRGNDEVELLEKRKLAIKIYLSLAMLQELE